MTSVVQIYFLVALTLIGFISLILVVARDMAQKRWNRG